MWSRCSCLLLTWSCVAFWSMWVSQRVCCWFNIFLWCVTAAHLERSNRFCLRDKEACQDDDWYHSVVFHFGHLSVLLDHIHSHQHILRWAETFTRFWLLFIFKHTLTVLLTRFSKGVLFLSRDVAACISMAMAVLRSSPAYYHLSRF